MTDVERLMSRALSSNDHVLRGSAMDAHDEIVRLRGELATMTENRNTLQRILSSIAPDQVPGPFICGTTGKQGDDGLFDGYLVCPQYGSDTGATGIFSRVHVRENSEG